MDEFTPGPGLERAEDARPYNLQEISSRMGREGYVARRNLVTASHWRRVNEAARLLADVIDGKADASLYTEALNPGRNHYRTLELQETYPGLFGGNGGSTDPISLRETMSTTDYSALTVDVLDRMLYGYYTAAPIETMPLVKKVSLRDFRVVARYAMDYGTKPFSAVYEDTGQPPIPHAPGQPPTERSMQQVAREVASPTARITYQPQLYQGKMAVNWRALVNDDLGIFQDMTNRLSIGGRRTVASIITSLYVSASGPNPTLYNSTFGNLITIAYGASSNNPPLSIQGLSDALSVIQLQRDLDGQPITFEGGVSLWFGPRLFTTAMNILKSVQTDVSVLGGTTNAQGFPSLRLRVENWMANGIKPIQDKYIPIVCTTSGVKDTMWGLTYDPGSQARPSAELGFLKEFDTIQVYQKVPNTMRAGGGVDPMLGDFYTMDQEYKGLIVLGGAPMDGRSTVASTGQGV